MSVPKCTSWRGHKFEARYSEAPPVKQLSDEWLAVQGMLAIPRIIAASKPKTYHRDICVRCGFTIERHSAPAEPKTQAQSTA